MGEVHQLPLFEGKRPEAHEIRLTGRVGSSLAETPAIGTTLYFLVRAKVAGVNHFLKGKERVFTRGSKLEILGAQQVDPASTVADQIVADAYAFLESLGDEPDDDEGPISLGGDA